MHWAADAQGTIIHRSPDWLQFTGLSEGDPRSKIRSKAVHPDDYSAVERLFEQAFALQAPFLLTCRLRNGNDDSYRWVVSGASPAMAPLDGSFLGYLGSTECLADVPMAPKVMDLLHASGRPTTKGSVLMLDAMADHILIAKALADRNGDKSIATTLAMVLLLIGDLLYRSINGRKAR